VRQVSFTLLMEKLKAVGFDRKPTRVKGGREVLFLFLSLHRGGKG